MSGDVAITSPDRPRSAPTRLFSLDPRQLAQARQLTADLVRRDLKVRHRGTFLGMVWSLTNPLLVVGLYYVVFTYLLKGAVVRDAPSVPFALYLFCGLTVWNLFANAVTSAPGSVTGSGYLLRKIYFPRAILPLATVLSALVTFAFETVVLVAVTVLFVGVPGPEVLWLPLVVAIVVVFAYGAALFLSALTVFLRDVAHFIGIFMQLWFWATPIIYSLKQFENRPSVGRVLHLNPMTGVVVSFRNVVLLGRGPELGLLAYDALWAVGLMAIGLWTFNHWQKLFPEIV